MRTETEKKLLEVVEKIDSLFSDTQDGAWTKKMFLDQRFQEFQDIAQEMGIDTTPSTPEKRINSDVIAGNISTLKDMLNHTGLPVEQTVQSISEQLSAAGIGALLSQKIGASRG
jgi:hypothetical protein